jgi:hypothetical protein
MNRHEGHDERSYDGAVPSTATDLRYGRRGGGWLPAGYSEHREDRWCPVCGGLLTCGQDVHQACEPAVLTLFGDDE